jgi:CRP-like cAMP-binding protein
MEEKFIAYFSSFQPLTPEEIEAITASMVIREVAKGTILLSAGQQTTDNYFVLSGCVRQYYLVNGEEKTTHFYTEETWILPAIGFPAEEGVDYYLECAEDSFLVVGNEAKGNELLDQFPKFQALSRKILEQEIIRQQTKLAVYQNSTPEQRYLSLQQAQADLMERIPQYQLASYIGVKPESLSRIRKRLAARG